MQCSKSIPVGHKKRKRIPILDEMSAHIMNEMLLATKLRKLEQEREARENPLTKSGIIQMSKKNTTTASSTVDVAAKDTQITVLLEESERLCAEKCVSCTHI